MTLTIELPDDLAARAAAAGLAPEQVSRFAVAGAVAAVTVATDQAQADQPNHPDEVDPELIVSLRQGERQAEEGRLLTLEQVDANVDDALAAWQSNRKRFTPCKAKAR